MSIYGASAKLGTGGTIVSNKDMFLPSWRYSAPEERTDMQWIHINHDMCYKGKYKILWKYATEGRHTAREGCLHNESLFFPEKAKVHWG